MIKMFHFKNISLRHMVSITLSGVFLVVMAAGCAPPVRKAPPLLKPTPKLLKIAPDEIPSLTDDLDPSTLITAIERSLTYLDRLSPETTLTVGDRSITTGVIKASLIAFRNIMASNDSNEVKQQQILDSFEFYRTSAANGRKQTLITGYFESLLNGSFVKTDVFRYPIYSTPEDLIVVNLRKFNQKYQKDQIIGRVAGKELVPYYTRDDIDFKRVLVGRNFEIVWVNDPVGLFTMHTHGSGKIKMPDGSLLQLSYSQRNGRPFRSDSGILLDLGKIDRKNLSYRNVKSYLRNHPDEAPDVFRKNESYIFFRIVEEGPVGAIGVPLVPSRSIAVDPDLYPLGGIALLSSQKPELNEKGRVSSWIPFTRFVLCQDTGGLIKGQHIDLYCGSGDKAENVAGSYKEQGDLYILLLKQPN
ncbi:MAG: MltA domain-containing protein [Syntrophales bacterium]